MREIKLTQGKVALVDDEDFEELNRYWWCTLESQDKFYATRRVGNALILMHRIIMNTPPELKVDHKDGDGLNCQKYNMRNCTQAQNCQNRKPNSNKKSKGVCYRGNLSGYCARITVSGQYIHLGLFKTDKEAAQAYNNAAIKYFGEFAQLNIIEKEEVNV